ncbi:MAG: helix-turn-helix domain-containing protein, partial [Nanoarchaeota archaeon]
MAFIQRRITIVTLRKPAHANLNEELQWFGSSLGLFGLRDKDKSMFRVFLELVKAAKSGNPLSSDELAETLNLTRGTVVHHINKLIEAGIVLYDGKHYWLRDN